MSAEVVLRPAAAARRLGVPTKVIVRAMYKRKLPRVRLAHGTLGIPADALAGFQLADPSGGSADLPDADGQSAK